MGIFFCFLPLILAVLIFSLCFKLNFLYQIAAIFIGLVAVIPISFIQFFLPDIPFFVQYPLWHTIFKSLIIYGFVEELFKMLIALTLPHKKLDTFHFLLLVFVMGLSLGCFESVVYFLDHLQKANAKGAQLLYGNIFIRIFTSDIIHMMCAGLNGLFLVTFRQKNAQSKPKISLFFISVLLHGFYDFFAGFSNFLKFFSFIVILLSLAECRVKYTGLMDKDQ